MFKLKTGYFISGITTGLIILFSFLGSLPDGKLHVYFCNVGQGDSAYIRFPDGRDMIVDGGPNDSVLKCLGNHMPFWDRSIDMMVLSHPQNDHLKGLISVVERYHIRYFIHSDITNPTEGFRKLEAAINKKCVTEKFVISGESIGVDTVRLHILWPSAAQINVLGATTVGNLNDGSVVFWLRYGNFDALFPGDADSHVEDLYMQTRLSFNPVEVLKVPHHGSKTGMTKAFIDWLKPKLAVISVGKNTYGHPSQEALNLLDAVGTQILRTDKVGDIEIVSDGRSWKVN